MKINNETKVGILVLVSIVLAMSFAWIMGIQNPFNRSVEFYVTYNFAGGIDVGSPVRVSGIKVGKVEKIEFFSPQSGTTVGIKEPGSTPESANPSSTQPGDSSLAAQTVVAPLRIKISVKNEAAAVVRKDSRFYINLAGIIGERYIEITPGTQGAMAVKAGDTLAGIDPPRIDQLISQSFDLFGKIKDFVEQNKGDLTKSIELLYKLSGNLNQTLAWVDKSNLFKNDFSKLIGNLIVVTDDLKKLTKKANSPEANRTLDLMYELIWRLEPLDAKQVRQFLQKEGVKVQMF